jgi:hypothetical protein
MEDDVSLEKRPAEEADRVVNFRLIHQAHAVAGSGFEADSQQASNLFGRIPFAD